MPSGLDTVFRIHRAGSADLGVRVAADASTFFLE